MSIKSTKIDEIVTKLISVTKTKSYTQNLCPNTTFFDQEYFLQYEFVSVSNKTNFNTPSFFCVKSQVTPFPTG
jgi:hypothetical protein